MCLCLFHVLCKPHLPLKHTSGIITLSYNRAPIWFCLFYSPSVESHLFPVVDTLSLLWALIVITQQMEIEAVSQEAEAVSFITIKWVFLSRALCPVGNRLLVTLCSYSFAMRTRVEVLGLLCQVSDLTTRHTGFTQIGILVWVYYVNFYPVTCHFQ